MAYEVRLEVFQGPIDLLLHLITRQRVDIYEVSISTITEEYLAALSAREDLDLETATGFLVIAATLLELKSARLLPRRDLGVVDARLLEERDLLLARLVECSTYREAGAWLAGALAEGARYYGRDAGLEDCFVDIAPDLLARVTLEHLGRAAALALAPKPQLELDVSHVQPWRTSVREAVVEVATALARSRRAQTFEELCGRSSERMEVVVRFLALLELFKAGAVELEQPETFGSISARWTGSVAAEEVALEAEEYSLTEETR